MPASLKNGVPVKNPWNDVKIGDFVTVDYGSKDGRQIHLLYVVKVNGTVNFVSLTDPTCYWENMGPYMEREKESEMLKLRNILGDGDEIVVHRN